ncbi:MAG: hypothetical protein KA314_28750 [Chloroflexi bacterium]|nr:hypothetical protein [Chloroflexota bacterium]
MKKRSDRYHSFLLRVWREAAQPGVWRASLQEVKTEKVIGFGKVQDLAAFLEWLIQSEEYELNDPLLEE